MLINELQVFYLFYFNSGRVEREIIEDMKRVDRTGTGSIQRSYSITSAPTIRTLGRSNTAPLPNNESPDRSAAYYHNKG